MGDVNLSEMKATYYPQRTSPGFIAAHAPIKHGTNTFFGEANINYFQNYRNENLSRMQMPLDEWGMIKSPYTPNPDIVVLGSTKPNPYLKLPSIKNAMNNPQRQKEIDDFYYAVQYHRDQLMDHSNKLHPLDYFKRKDFMYQCPRDAASSYVKHRERYIQYQSPPVFPLTLGRSTKTPSLPCRALTGTFSPSSDYRFTR